MRRILICTGVLGGGSALVFAAAAVTSLLLPPSRIVPQGQMIMVERAMPANFGGPVRALTTDQAVGADVLIEPPTPEEVP